MWNNHHIKEQLCSLVNANCRLAILAAANRKLTAGAYRIDMTNYGLQLVRSVSVTKSLIKDRW